ncbi:MAG: AIR synthase related protein, partial [Acidimicrobiales bacterium]
TGEAGGADTGEAGGADTGEAGGAAPGEAGADCGADLLAMLVDPSWVYRQYDHQLFLNTVVGPGGDAALLRLAAPGVRPGPGAAAAMALSTDGNHRWCAVDPRAGTALVVAESALNVACVGARPVALVNCLNLGNPEHPEVMWQLSEAVDGMAEACRALSIPVVGGNVSLYNESRGTDIDPTPVVGTLGLVDRLERPPPGIALAPGGRILLLGGGGVPALGGSLWAATRGGGEGGPLAPLDLAMHARLLGLVAGLVNGELAAGGLVGGVHDVADGGLGVALAEMAVQSGVGFRVAGVAGPLGLFGEAPSRVVACVAPEAVAVVGRLAEAAGVGWAEIGDAGGDRMVVEGLVDVGLAEATERWREALPATVGGRAR